MTILYK